MADELSAVEAVIDELACADSTISACIGDEVYSEVADQDAGERYLLFKFLAGSDTQGPGTHRSQSNPLYLLTLVWKDAATEEVRRAVAALDEVFGKLRSRAVTLDTGETYTVSARREAPHKMVEIDKQTMARYTHKGGRYRFYVSKSGE